MCNRAKVVLGGRLVDRLGLRRDFSERHWPGESGRSGVDGCRLLSGPDLPGSREFHLAGSRSGHAPGPGALEIPNPELKLLLGMFVNVRLGLPLGDQLAISATECFSPARVRSHSWTAAAGTSSPGISRLITAKRPGDLCSYRQHGRCNLLSVRDGPDLFMLLRISRSHTHFDRRTVRLPPVVQIIWI